MVKEMPETVVKALLDDQEFVAFADHPVLSYGEIGSFRHQDIISALDKASLSGGKADLLSRDGHRFVLTRLPNGNGATLAENDAEDRLVWEFGLLDPERDSRLLALATVERKCWPCLSSAEMWRSVLIERPLSEIELAHLASDIRETPSQFLSGLKRKWMSGGQVGAEEVFPTTSAYYSALVGSPSDAGNMDEWIADFLVRDLKRGVERSVVDGLRQALALNIDSRLSPAKLVGNVSDEALLDALGKLVQTVSPYALLGILEIALARVVQERKYAVLASDALDRLFGEQSKTNGVEAAWKLLPALIRVGMGSFVSGWERWAHMPYWRRLAAHAHANVLVELFNVQGTDADRFVDWLEGIVVEGEVATNLLDWMQEPMWRAWDISSRQMRASMIARLMLLKGNIVEMGLGPTLDAAVEVMKKDLGQLDAERPGPIVGIGMRMKDLAESGATDDAEVSEFFMKTVTELELNPLGESWKILSVACRLLRFDEGLRAKLAAVVGRAVKVDGDEESRQFLETLLLAADISATQPDEAIARNVAETLVGAAGRYISEVDVVTGLRVLIVAAGAIRARTRGMEWLADRISEFAFNIPRGLPCRRLLFELEALQKLIPIRDRYFGRAMKIAVAGMD